MSRATDQSEALMIAGWLESGGGHGVPSMHAIRAARELRRLDRVKAELVEALRNITDQLERVGDTRTHKDGKYIEEARAALTSAKGDAQ